MSSHSQPSVTQLINHFRQHMRTGVCFIVGGIAFTAAMNALMGIPAPEHTLAYFLLITCMRFFGIGSGVCMILFGVVLIWLSHDSIRCLLGDLARGSR